MVNITTVSIFEYEVVYIFFLFPRSIHKPFIEFLVSISSDVSGLSVSIKNPRPVSFALYFYTTK